MTWQPTPTDTPTDTPSAADEEEFARRLGALTLEQKVRLLTGADFWSLHPEPAVGLRRLVVSDGPAGVRGELWDERSPAANVPSPTALAATWDEPLIERLGGLLAHEARGKGVDVLLAPTVNLHRTPYGGRHFECFSEDPLLTARIGVAYVRGVQDGGVAATVKHFVGNDSETERMTVDARIGERALRELYLAPFEAIVGEGRVWAVMAAYNGVNGHPMTESPLLREVLHDDWGFDGLVMSDWFAARTTEQSARAALDLVMPGPIGPWGDALVAAVRKGKVDEAVVDDKVLRVLRLAARVGALSDMPTTAWPPEHDAASVTARLRETAAAGFVLARNEDAVLPLDRSALSRIAVLGPNAAVARTLGGGSATVFPPYTVSPLDGIRAALGDDVEVTHGIGVTPQNRTPVAAVSYLRHPDGSGEGAEVRFLAADGTLLGSERRAGAAYTWMGSYGPGVPVGRVARVEVHTVVRATEAGRYAIGGSGIGRFRMSVAGAEVFDVRLQLPPGADLVEGLMTPPQRLHTVDLAEGEETEIVLTHDIDSVSAPASASAGDAVGDAVTMFQLNLQPPHGSDDEEIERAVALARAADVAVVVVGTTEEVESEGFDRDSLALPGRQDELVRRVAEANPRTVVVVNSGAPVLLPWAEEVAAVLLAWFPGQEFGNALADVLLGVAEPGGRLPTVWPASERGLPATEPVEGVLAYDEGLFIGYRGDSRAGWQPPRYGFGHGLGYTTWEYVSIDVPGEERPDADFTAEVRIRNSGARHGKEVVQVYAGRPGGGVERPLRWLAGFAVVEAAAGAEAVATVTVDARALRHWDTEAGQWAVEPGTFRLEAGPSSTTLPLTADIAVGRE
ncbi:beta-glucosidase [Streptomyces sp. NBC_00878]|uniref:beta-glucosidase family protein n=1 Tax=Streptomyces sp. NBC_00878 TaxID=2975854 RepID=UPI00224D7FF1|nr:glycoside hydrolase family 3 C-terminal domain-containing protein [Streptomyces sp. NBC_00878]MCX4911175.1 glycoside hydrolase family 3 C-terminal domain-containing protein [Streptomyces sp. NBC_00878]